jgi:hypothetical protein
MFGSACRPHPVSDPSDAALARTPLRPRPLASDHAPCPTGPPTSPSPPLSHGSGRCRISFEGPGPPETWQVCLDRVSFSILQGPREPPGVRFRGRGARPRSSAQAGLLRREGGRAGRKSAGAQTPASRGRGHGAGGGAWRGACRPQDTLAEPFLSIQPWGSSQETGSEHKLLNTQLRNF